MGLLLQGELCLKLMLITLNQAHFEMQIDYTHCMLSFSDVKS